MSAPAVRSQRCSAIANGTGEQCKKLAILGATVCGTHGGSAPQVKMLAAQRVALAEAAARNRRDPWAVLADVTATADELFRRARAEVAADSTTAETMGALLERMESAGRWARQLIDSGHAEREVRMAEGQAQHLAAAVGRILDALNLSEEQRALVGTVVPRELRRQGRLAIEAGEGA